MPETFIKSKQKLARKILNSQGISNHEIGVAMEGVKTRKNVADIDPIAAYLVEIIIPATYLEDITADIDNAIMLLNKAKLACTE